VPFARNECAVLLDLPLGALKLPLVQVLQLTRLAPILVWVVRLPRDISADNRV
jgi:hypothetical protein